MERSHVGQSRQRPRKLVALKAEGFEAGELVYLGWQFSGEGFGCEVDGADSVGCVAGDAVPFAEIGAGPSGGVGGFGELGHDECVGGGGMMDDGGEERG